MTDRRQVTEKLEEIGSQFDALRDVIREEWNIENRDRDSQTYRAEVDAARAQLQADGGEVHDRLVEGLEKMGTRLIGSRYTITLEDLITRFVDRGEHLRETVYRLKHENDALKGKLIRLRDKDPDPAAPPIPSAD